MSRPFSDADHALGEIAYNAWKSHYLAIAATSPKVDWRHLEPYLQSTWIVAAKAVKAEVLANLPHTPTENE